VNAERCERTAELSFGHPVEAVFEMFTPEGERGWADGWDPVPIHPSGETGVRDAVFATEHGGAHAVWLVTELDAANNVVEYVNFVDGERVTRVGVACESVAPSATRAVVRYVVTGLSEAGNAYVRRFDAHFDAFMGDWRRAIAAALDARS
jgi:hypothetical protein